MRLPTVGEPGSRPLIMAHPFDDLYGSDRMFLQAVAALAGSGWSPMVALPGNGPLAAAVRDLGVPVTAVDVPVLRRAALTPTGLPVLAGRSAVAAVRLAALIRDCGRPPVYVNTLTAPTWLTAARLAGVPGIAHVHEAEQHLARPVRRALAWPLLQARTVIANSGVTAALLTSDVPRLARRTVVVPNGVPALSVSPARPVLEGPVRLLVIGRLSPRKAPHVAIRVLGELRSGGLDATLTLVGDVFSGYEWYADELRRLVAELGLTDVVTFSGFQSDVAPFVAACDVVLLPSEGESFGNVAVEALSAERPVVASDVQGLAEVLRHDRTGFLVPVGDVAAMAGQVRVLVDDWARARSVAAAGRLDAAARFSPERFRARLDEVVSGTRMVPAMRDSDTSVTAETTDRDVSADAADTADTADPRRAAA
ncbi:MAG: hypothetical protein QOJ32_712 [Frankiaceae bacterium]|nr:hypothetical protein [Frankiaceae bacterium]